MEEEDQKKLLSERQDSSDSISSYGSAEQEPEEDTHEVAAEDDRFAGNKITVFLYKHREKIPGYWTLQLILRPYPSYVLVMMLIAYLLNQLDRYTLPVVTTHAGADLRYGDKSCRANPNISAGVWNNTDLFPNATDQCTDKLLKHNETLCRYSHNVTFDYDTGNHTFNGSICQWWWDGSGLLYQIVAGPVFNNLYILAGVFMGFLADYGSRKVWLVISLVFWSIVTGVTGFVTQYWQIVILRALLAIGAAGCSPFAVSIIGDYFPKELRGAAMGIYYWGIYFGYSLAFAIGNGITKVLNWRWVFFISGLVGIAVAPIILFTVKEPERKKTPTAERTSEKDKLTTKEKIITLIWTFFRPGMFLLCIAGGIRNAGGYVWGYNTELFFTQIGFSDDTINSFQSWIPLVSGSLGAVLGGLISDLLVRNRGPYVRIWVLIVSQILAAPFAAGALFLPYPFCFLTLIPSNVIGEMWVGVTTAIVVDLAPSKIRTAAVAVYLFIITLIGGNFNLLVSPLVEAFQNGFDKSTSYRWALFLTFPCLYALSSALFLLTFFVMRWDLKRKKEREACMINVSGEDGEHVRSAEVGVKGEKEEGEDNKSLLI